MSSGTTVAPVVVGNSGFTEQPVRLEYEKTRGLTKIRTWLGPTSGLEAFRNQLLQNYTPDSMSTETGVPAKITLTLPEELTGSGLPSSFASEDQRAEDEALWELVPQRLEKDLASHGYFNVSGAAVETMEQIDRAIRQGKASSKFHDWDTESGLTHMNDYRNLRLTGVNSYIMWTWIIRQTIITNDSGTYKITHANEKAQQVVKYSEIPIPLTVRWDQPQARIYDVNNGGWSLTKIDEWLTEPPAISIRLVARRAKQYEVKREWSGAQMWSKALYDRSALAGTGKVTMSG